MEIICVITEWAAAFTENIIALSAVALAAGKKKGHNKYILYLSALSFVATIIIRIMNQIESFSYITAVLAILISVLGAKFLSSGSVWIRLSAAILTFTVIYSVDYIVVALVHSCFTAGIMITIIDGHSRFSKKQFSINIFNHG